MDPSDPAFLSDLNSKVLILEINTGARYGCGILNHNSSPALNLPNELWAAKVEIDALKNDIVMLKAEVIRLANNIPSPLPSMGSQPSAPICPVPFLKSLQRVPL
jgi:hypothetical protein